MDLSSKVKHLFNFPKDKNGKPVIELRALTHGIPPKTVKYNLNKFIDEWQENGVDAWNNLEISKDVFSQNNSDQFGWWTLPEVVGDNFISPTINAPKGTCIMMSNASQIMFSILSCTELNKPTKRKIICTDGEFSSVLHTLHHFNKQYENHSPQVKKH